jgi:hypothetical protein
MLLLSLTINCESVMLTILTATQNSICGICCMLLPISILIGFKKRLNKIDIFVTNCVFLNLGYLLCAADYDRSIEEAIRAVQ